MVEYIVHYFKAQVVSRRIESEDRGFHVDAGTLEEALKKAHDQLWGIEERIGAGKIIAYARLQAPDKCWHEIEGHCDDTYRLQIERLLEGNV
ncbi:MAG: hypothetical protein QT08_C0008G0037 [archaeon GW2011_AR17]|nr:MAG: hypothetical protein QT08_C0008G0037 [archaeon GW2011_AR17]MBS3153800.1 hypothetical protein [Candidatus Woesearchaeota archaeon]HIH15174.1 hypothetical protein [Nanoarchaeota archaeon]HIH59440.1 hypothetical protein [Nanoarchaeota archaeon]HII13838.1 hypothetical protein [Nanoarchaeota archaeon]